MNMLYFVTCDKFSLNEYPLLLSSSCNTFTFFTCLFKYSYCKHEVCNDQCFHIS